MVKLMSMDLISILKDNVSSIVLQGETDHLFEKDQALGQFYPIFLSILRAKPEWIQHLTQQLNPKITELFGGNGALKQQFLNQFAGQVPQDELEQTLNQSIAPTLGFLQTEAGATDPEAVTHLLDTHASSIQQALPLWAGPILASLGLSQNPTQHLHQQPETVTPVQQVIHEDKPSRSWLPLILFLVLAAIALFLYKACSSQKDANAPANAAVQSATKQPASLQLSTGADANITSCQIHLHNPSYLDILQNEIKQIFNHNIGCGAITDDAYHSQFIDQDTIPSVLKMIQGTPNLSLNWVGDQVSIQAANPADAERIAGQIRGLAKNLNVVTQQALNPDDAVNTANSDAEKALASIKTDNVRALDVATALNLQIVNFATGSAEIPDVNKSILDQGAALLQRASHVHLKVIGHTDAQGDAAANKTLSLKRAQSIVDYLIQQGVDPAQLQAVGMGQEQPRAENTTEEGRFKNRRIEFEVMNTETGVVRSVDDQGVQKQ